MKKEKREPARFGRTHPFILTGVVLASALGGCGSSDNSGSSLKLNIQNGVSSAGDFTAPFDATPDPDGKNVYFTALTPNGDPAVFKASAAAGGGVTMLFSGLPLAAPVSIAISEDGATLFIADTTADNSGTGDDDSGAIFTLPTGGGTPSPMAGTESTNPRGVAVVGDQLWFTGITNGQPGLRKIPIAGGAPSDVAVGDPFVDPSGVTVTADGVAYVADTGDTISQLIKVDGSAATVFTANIPVGFPAGVALTKDESSVLVSGFDTTAGSDIVYAIPVSNGSDTSQTFNTTINQFSESAGLHRAKNLDTFAWADSQAGGMGTVYVLTK
jgi:hypothetical protein